MENRETLVRKAFRAQARACAGLESPFMELLCNLLAERLNAADRVGSVVLKWQGDPGSGADSVPLRLAGALHALVLSQKDAALALAYPPNPVNQDDLWTAIAAAFASHPSHFFKMLESPPQTNEVRRSSAIMCGLLAVAQKFGLPFELLELGSSAGLNLVPDRYCHRLGHIEVGENESTVLLEPVWRGAPAKPAPIAVVSRAGCDLRPISITSPENLERLKAYIWADQPARMERTVAAWRIAGDHLQAGAVEKADAAQWLRSCLGEQQEGVARFLYHTVAWQYFPSTVQQECIAAIERAAARATFNAPLAHFSMEADGGEGAALKLRTWPGGELVTLGRSDFHGRWIELF